MESSSLGRIDELAARLGHERSLTMLDLFRHRAEPKVGSDLSEGCVSAFFVPEPKVGSDLSEGCVSKLRVQAL